MRTYGRPRVLICDEDGDTRGICQSALVAAGYEATLAAHADAALAALRQGGHDVYVLDMTAGELLSVLRKHDPDAPCLILYGSADFDGALALLRRGASDFVRKPVDATELVASVDQVLASTHVKADSALLAVTQSIFSSLDAQEIVRRVLGVARSLLQADNAALFIFGEGSGGRTAEGYRGTASEDAVAAPAESPASPVMARLLDLRDPAVLDAGTFADLPAVEVLSPESGSIIVQRLAIGERALGLLCAGRAVGARPFSDADMRRAMLLAGHVSLAFENARLHDVARDQARRLEQALDRLVVAERVAMLARLASGLGHEIANPASAILAHLELARADLAAGKLTAVDEALVRATAGANAVIDVTRALRPLAGANALGVVDLRAVIDGALLLTSHQLRGRAKVTIDAPGAVPAVLGDPAKLGQVFMNLLINAAQAIPPGAEAKNELHITIVPSPKEVLVRIEDTGPGIPAEVLPRLFQPSVTTKTSGTGHGMGLAVCRWILDEINGSIRALPARPRGAAFEVKLPRA